VVGNRLLGPQVGIALFGVDDAMVSDNRCRYVWYGVVAHESSRATIRNNDLSDAVFGVLLGAGTQNRVLGNEVRDAAFGVTADVEETMRVEDNDLRNCIVWGSVLFVTGSTSFLDNRVANSGYAAGPKFGVFVIDLLSWLDSGDTLRMENCELIDIGIGPNGETSAGAAHGLAAWVHSCEISGNHIGYSGVEQGLEAGSEHRALLLAGPLLFIFDKGRAGRLSSALITGNQFRGPGLSSLVELLSLSLGHLRFEFERVAFSNNSCEHWNTKPVDYGATVQLRGAYPIVMGNHVKCLDPNINSISLNAPMTCTIMGNVATGPYVLLGNSPIPAPWANFNVQLP
jgi:parallel beta-helix repeat protein